jgi:hypothetical protein
MLPAAVLALVAISAAPEQPLSAKCAYRPNT